MCLETVLKNSVVSWEPKLLQLGSLQQPRHPDSDLRELLSQCLLWSFLSSNQQMCMFTCINSTVEPTLTRKHGGVAVHLLFPLFLNVRVHLLHIFFAKYSMAVKFYLKS